MFLWWTSPVATTSWVLFAALRMAFCNSLVVADQCIQSVMVSVPDAAGVHVVQVRVDG